MKTLTFLFLSLFFTLISNAQIPFNNSNNKDSKLTHIIWNYQDNLEFYYYYDEYMGYIYDSLDIISYNYNDTNNIWQVGSPNKGSWINGYTQTYPDTFPSKVLITDTLNSYPVNNHSWFEIHVRKPLWTAQFNYCWSNFVVTFYYKCESDTLNDGVFIEISFDGGNTYTDIFDTSAVKNAINGPDYFSIFSPLASLFNNHNIISGTSQDYDSNGWTTCQTEFIWENNNGFEVDYSILRFHFISDSIQSYKRGFMIDNLWIMLKDECHIIGIKDTKTDDTMNIIPNPITMNSILEFSNDFNSITHLEIYNAYGQLLYKESTSGNLFEIGKISLLKGVYFYKLINSQLTNTGKFIIN